ncbi:hypothetical protein AB7M74_010713 [Bradyrhizobium japonicum]
MDRRLRWCGCRSVFPANTYLRLTDESSARKLIKAGYKFLNWAKPDTIRETAQNYIENGWPLVDMLATRTQDLADCERIRNKIAHNSTEAVQQFSVVQRNLLATERLFDLSPGQLLKNSIEEKESRTSRFLLM